MINKLIKISGIKILIASTFLLLLLLIVAMVLLVTQASINITLALLVLLALLIVVAFIILSQSVFMPILSLQQYLLGNKTELPKLITLNLFKELGDIVYEVNKLQALLVNQFEQSNHQEQIVSKQEENIDFFSTSIAENIDAIKSTCRQIEYKNESEIDQRNDLQKEYKKFKSKLTRLKNNQKNTTEFLNESQKILNKILNGFAKNEPLLLENINIAYESKTACTENEAILKRVTEMSFKANLLAINTQLEAKKLGYRGEELNKLAVEWQQLAAYNVQTSKQFKVVVDDGKSLVEKLNTLLLKLQKELTLVNDNVVEGVTSASINIEEAKTVQKTIDEIQKESDRLEANLFKSDLESNHVSLIFKEVAAIKNTLKTWKALEDKSK